MKKYLLITIFGLLLFAGQSEAATFYMDTSCNTPGDGTSPTCAAGANDPYDNPDDFADTARAAGDKLIMRRGIASSSFNGTDVVFTSDGNVTNPITMEADYDNIWGDFASSSQTYTVTRGARQMTANASITGIAAGDWIYVYDDKTNRRDFAYEVATVSGTVLTLYFPYKGDNPGTGLTLTVMPDAPFWNTIAGDFQWTLSDDNHWSFQGLDLRGTDLACTLDGVGGGVASFLTAKDMIILGNDATNCAIRSGYAINYFSKIRNDDTLQFIGNSGAGGAGYFSNLFVDCDSNDTFITHTSQTPLTMFFVDVVASGSCTTSSVNISTGGGELKYRNYTGPISYVIGAATGYGLYFYEDINSIVGSNSQGFGFTDSTVASASTPLDKTLSTLRSGGGASSLKILPPGGGAATGISTNSFPKTYIKLFEYPIYLNTSQTTLSMFFKPDNTASWSADPTASQLWVEIDVLASSSGAFRYTKKSTGVLDFNGSSAWQALTIPVIASQSGNAYLRGYYGKPKELVGTSTGDANIFFMDVEPTITQP